MHIRVPALLHHPETTTVIRSYWPCKKRIIRKAESALPPSVIKTITKFVRLFGRCITAPISAKSNGEKISAFKSKYRRRAQAQPHWPSRQLDFRLHLPRRQLARHSPFIPHRFAAAARAISARRSGVKAFARARPPFKPPSRPIITAATSRPSSVINRSVCSPVAISVINLASWFGSRGRGIRFESAMRLHLCHHGSVGKQKCLSGDA